MISAFVLICIISLLPTHTNAQLPALPAQQSCSTFTYVGNNVVSPPAIPVQLSHGAGQSVLVYDTTYTIPCTCGLITGWHMVRYDSLTDGCKAFPCHATLMVYRNLNLTAMTATLVGFYNATNIEAITPTSGYIPIAIPQSNVIKVKYGDYLGWEGSPSPVTYYEEAACSGTCPSGLASTRYHYYGSNKSPLTAGSQIGFFNGPSNSYAYWRYFGFRVIVSSGTAPYFTNLPITLNLNDSITVGTVVYTVKADDKETPQSLTLTSLWTCPFTVYFSFDTATGDVTLIRSLVEGPAVHTLAVEVTDDCFKAEAELTINVKSPLDMTTASPTVGTASKNTPNPLSSPIAASLLAITILASLVAIGSSIGMCVLGSQMNSVTKELGEIHPMRNSQAIPNNAKNSNLDRGNRKSYSPQKSGVPRNASRTNQWDSIPSSTPTTHGSDPPSNNRLTSVEQLPKPIPSPRPSLHNYPPRDMLYW